MDIRRDFYRAYSDINVLVNSFLNINTPRNNYSQSKGKSNTCAKEIFHNLILHSHFLLHLNLITFFVLNISHTHKFIIRNKHSFQNKQGYRRGDYKTLVDEEDTGPSCLLKRTVSCLCKAKPFNQLTSYRDCHSVRYPNP